MEAFLNHKNYFAYENVFKFKIPACFICLTLKKCRQTECCVIGMWHWNTLRYIILRCCQRHFKTNAFTKIKTKLQQLRMKDTKQH